MGPVEQPIEILDTSGNDFYNNLHEKVSRSLNRRFNLQWWKWADAFIYVYAINQKYTFDLVKTYYNEIKKAKKSRKQDYPILLVGTQGMFAVIFETHSTL